MMSQTDLNTTPCLSDLEIADLVADLLDGEARDSALRHVAQCEDCYEIYADAQACLEDLDEQDEAPQVSEDSSSEPAVVLPFSAPGENSDSQQATSQKTVSRKTWTAWAPAAIAASLLVGIGLATMLPDGSRQGSVAEWASFGGLPSFEAQMSQLPSASVVRGIGSASRIAGDFRLGAAWAHLGAALNAHVEPEEGTIKEMHELIQERVESGDLSEELGRELEVVLDFDGAADGAIAKYREVTPRLSEEMATLGYELDLGRFTETGRLAALTGAYEWFEPKGEAALYLQEIQDLETTPETEQNLDAIQSVWPTGELDEKSFGEVAEAFTDLILAYDAEANAGQSDS